MPSFCAYFNQNRCRSCDQIEVPYSDQVIEKERRVKESLGAIFKQIPLERSVTSPEQSFRNRIKMSVTGTLESPIIGLVGSENLDQGREILGCPIHHPRLNELLLKMPEWLTHSKIEPYSIASRKGELKGLIAYYSPGSHQMYLRFVLRSKAAVSLIIKYLPKLQVAFTDLVCVSANIQPIPHAILEGPEEIFITERKSIDQSIGDLTLKLAPQAFVQTNAEVATLLYQTAAHWIGESKSKQVTELFSGQGAFSFFAARSAEKIIGVEINKDAVATANETARRLGYDHLSFIAADAAALGLESEALKADLILVNPPRRGLGGAVDLLLKILPKHLIYSSCDCESLARDLTQLSPHYQMKKIQLFDLFPHTKHFETLVWLKATL